MSSKKPFVFRAHSPKDGSNFDFLELFTPKLMVSPVKLKSLNAWCLHSTLPKLLPKIGCFPLNLMYSLEIRWFSTTFSTFCLVQEASHSDPCAESLEHHTVPPRRARGMLQPPRRRWQRGTLCCPGGGQGTWWENTRKSGVVRCVLHLRFLFICDILVFSSCVYTYIYMCVYHIYIYFFFNK